MAIGYTLLLKDKKLSKEILLKTIESLGYSNSIFEQLPKGVLLNLNKEIGFSVYLLDSGDYPYNLWETDFLETDFMFGEILEFRLVKDYSETERRYTAIFEIIFQLATELKETAILVGNGDTELCFFRTGQGILLNSKSGIWNADCIKDVLNDYDIYYA